MDPEGPPTLGKEGRGYTLLLDSSTGWHAALSETISVTHPYDQYLPPFKTTGACACPQIERHTLQSLTFFRPLSLSLLQQHTFLPFSPSPLVHHPPYPSLPLFLPMQPDLSLYPLLSLPLFLPLLTSAAMLCLASKTTFSLFLPLFLPFILPSNQFL